MKKWLMITLLIISIAGGFPGLSWAQLANVDWSHQDSPVKDQDRTACPNAGWAFAIAALVENLGNQTDLSEQVLISCLQQSPGCNGDTQNYTNSLLNALAYVGAYGLELEDCYPYQQEDGNCLERCEYPVYREKVKGYDTSFHWEYPAGKLDDLKALLVKGPVVATMVVPPDGSFEGYTGGIYKYTGDFFSNQGEYLHAILVVGYDDSNEYFVAKNSWGTDWGENGYFRIDYGMMYSPIYFGGYALTAESAQTVAKLGVVQPGIADQYQLINFSPYTVADLNTIFIDPQGDPLTFSVTSDGHTTPQLNGSNLQLSSVPNFSGVSQVIVSATDGLETATNSFLTVVVPESKLLAASNSAEDFFGKAVAIDNGSIFVGIPKDDEEGDNAGSALQFIQENGSWKPSDQLILKNGKAYEHMGTAIDVSGDLAVVGAYGRVSVFKKLMNHWVEAFIIPSPDESFSDSFGQSVAISGNFIIIGAHGDDPIQPQHGAAFIYEVLPSYDEAVLSAQLQGTNSALPDYFGWSVDIDGEYVAVGAYGENTHGPRSGAVYFYKLRDGQWVRLNRVTPPDGDTDDFFGVSVSLSGDYAIIGAQKEDSSGTDAGAAYVYKQEGGSWLYQYKMTALDGDAGDNFGCAVEMDGDWAVVGAFGNDDQGGNSGSVYVFRRVGDIWAQQEKRLAPDGNSNDQFGYSVAIQGMTYAVGAIGDTYTTPKPGPNMGSVYAFPIEPGRPILLNPIPDQYQQVDFVSYTVADLDEVFYDPDGDPLTYTATGLPNTVMVEGTYSENNGYFTVQIPGSFLVLSSIPAVPPASSFIGTTDITVTATDGTHSVSQTFKVTVNVEGKIMAYDASQDDQFGWAVDLYSSPTSGDHAIMGAWGDAPNGTNSGSAYIYKREGNSWIQQAKLIPDDGAAGDQFGYDVAISGDNALVGAWKEADNGSDAGSAYIFHRDGASWNQQARLNPTDAAMDDKFGHAVAISGDYAMVGAYAKDTGTGAAYIFKQDSGAWNQTAKLVASDGQSIDYFGYDVDIDNEVAVVGAYGDDDKGAESGAAYIFTRAGEAWSQTAKLVPDDGEAGDRFGFSVAIYGDYAVVGATKDDDKGEDAGAAYIFFRNGGTWTQQAKLTAEDGQAYDEFGFSVAIYGDYAAIGARADDDKGNDAGALYIFQRSGTSWTQYKKFVADDGSIADYLGHSVAISGYYAMAGAHGDDGAGVQSGAAYIFVALDGVDLYPTMENLEDIVINKNDPTTGEIGFRINDPETPAGNLTVSASSDNPGLIQQIVLGGQDSFRTIAISPTANMFGKANITVSVNDGVNTISDTFLLTVNDPPTINPIGDQTTDEDVPLGPFDIQVADADSPIDSLVLSGSSSNPDLVPNVNITFSGTGATRQCTITPLENQFGTTQITVVVSDGYAETSTTFTLTVNAVNDPPTITSIDDQTMQEDNQLTGVTFTVGDVESDAANLVVSAVSSDQNIIPNTGITVSGTDAERSLTLTPVLNAFGTLTITVTVTDDDPVPATTSISFTLTVTAVNDLPIIEPINNVQIDKNTVMYRVPCIISDVETPVDQLTVTAISSNTDLVTNDAFIWEGTGSPRYVSAVPQPDQIGETTISITVQDTDNGASFTTFTLTVIEVAEGDVDASGVVDLADLILTLKVMAGVSVGVTPENFHPGADINGDKRIGMEEATYILQKIAGLR